MIETVPCNADVTVSLTVSVTPNCPISDETDEYDVTVEWTPAGNTIEKWSLYQHVMEYDGGSITQEGLCDELVAELPSDGLSDVTVTVTDTKHMDMEVES